MRPDVLCIGAVLWDVIGRTAGAMPPGADVPGTITRAPGGVAFNIAMTLARFGLQPAVLTAIGTDPAGDDLVAACKTHDILTHFVTRDSALPTDVYLAIEDARGLVAAVADARSLERAGARILAALEDGRLGTAVSPWQGPVALDGNLTDALLAQIAGSPLFARAQVRVAPASPGKATRLRVFMGHPTVVFHVNREEAGLLCDTRFATAPEAAAAMVARGAARALVTDGPNPAADASATGVIHATPLQVPVRRVTGAGDTFMAAHLAAETRGAPREAALALALQAAATFVSGDTV